MRSRKWFITINENSSCFGKVQTILDEERCKYIGILHNQDFKEDGSVNLHYHFCINFENARTFETMCSKFAGAHIEVCKYWHKSVRYLLHLDDASKFQYSKELLISNYDSMTIDMELNLDEFVHLDTESIIEKVNSGEVSTIVDAIKIWGIRQVNLYRNLINQVIEEVKAQQLREKEKTKIQEDYMLLKKQFLKLMHDYNSMRIHYGFEVVDRLDYLKEE